MIAKGRIQKIVLGGAHWTWVAEDDEGRRRRHWGDVLEGGLSPPQLTRRFRERRKLFQRGLKPLMIFSSFQEWANTMARRPSSVCKLLRKSLLLARKWPDHHQTFTRWTPGQHASRVCSRSRSRSKVTWYAHFLRFMEWATVIDGLVGHYIRNFVRFHACFNAFWNLTDKVTKPTGSDHFCRPLVWRGHVPPVTPSGSAHG